MRMWTAFVCGKALRRWCDEGRGFVDATINLKTGNNAGVLGGLMLNAFEVGGGGNDGVGDILAEVSLSESLFSPWDLTEIAGLPFFSQPGMAHACCKSDVER